MKIKVKAVVSGTTRLMKDSGVKWIGSIPENWDVQKVKNAFDRKKEEAHQKEPVVLSLARSGVKVRDISTNEGQLAESYYNYNLVEKGDLLLNPMDLYSGANCSISNVEGVISPAYINLRARSGYNPRYYDYYFKTQYWSMAFFAHGKGVSFDNRWTLGFEDLNNYQIPAPSFEEQNDIANCIDAQCARIDSVIEKTRESIEEYKKLKQSIITEAVTKGIRKYRREKSSSIEGLERIPEQWDEVLNAFLFREKVRKPYPDSPSLSLSQASGLILTDEMEERSLKTSTYDGWKRVELDDLVLNRFKAHLGVFFASTLKGMVSFHYGVYEPIQTMNSKYYEYLFHSDIYRGIYSYKSNGMTVGLQNLSNQNFYSVKSLFPPVEEQNEIVDYLDSKCHELEVLIERKEKLIEEMESFKQSLIFEFVTGKKEVPNC